VICLWVCRTHTGTYWGHR